MSGCGRVCQTHGLSIDAVHCSISYPTTTLGATPAGSHLTTQLLDTGMCCQPAPDILKKPMCPCLLIGRSQYSRSRPRWCGVVQYAINPDSVSQELRCWIGCCHLNRPPQRRRRRPSPLPNSLRPWLVRLLPRAVKSSRQKTTVCMLAPGSTHLWAQA